MPTSADLFRFLLVSLLSLSCLQWPVSMGCGGDALRRQSVNFRPPPKSPQGVKKSTQWRPKVDCSWMLRSFWCHFSTFFYDFSKMSKTMKSRCGGHHSLILRIQHLQNHSFFNEFSIKFSYFFWNPSWSDFLAISC